MAKTPTNSSFTGNRFQYWWQSGGGKHVRSICRYNRRRFIVTARARYVVSMKIKYNAVQCTYLNWYRIKPDKSPCLLKHHVMTMCGWGGGISSRIINLGFIWRWVVSVSGSRRFTPATQWIGGCAGPRVGQWREVPVAPLPEIESPSPRSSRL
jgi:hypothetical protein